MGYWPNSSSGILLISLTFMLYHRFMWTLQRHLGSIQQMLKKNKQNKKQNVFFPFNSKIHCTVLHLHNEELKHILGHALWSQTCIFAGKQCGVAGCPSDCDQLQIPQMAYCHDVSGSAFLLSHTDIGFSKNTALYPRVNRPQWDNTCCEIAGWKYGVTMSIFSKKELLFDMCVGQI